MNGAHITFLNSGPEFGCRNGHRTYMPVQCRVHVHKYPILQVRVLSLSCCICTFVCFLPPHNKGSHAQLFYFSCLTASPLLLILTPFSLLLFGYCLLSTHILPPSIPSHYVTPTLTTHPRSTPPTPPCSCVSGLHSVLPLTFPLTLPNTLLLLSPLPKAGHGSE